MTFLDRSIWHCCGYKSSTTIGDAFKLFAPTAWSAVCLMACLAYLISPLSRGDLPRWGSAVLVAASGVSGIGLSLSIYSFHRRTSSFAAEESCVGDGDTTIWQTKLGRRRRALRIHAILSGLFLALSVSLAVFFGAFASDLDKCAHETCGADVSWSCITLVVSLVWAGVTFLGYRHLQLRSLPKNGDGDGEMLEVP